MHEPQTGVTRRSYLRATAVASGLALGVAASTPAAARPPHFAGRIYADGDVWATKGVADLPMPTENNEQSYDKLFPSPGTDLLPVAEAGPGNRHYNGGRWVVYPLTWHDDVTPKQLTSYDEVKAYADEEKLSIADKPMDAFECPLVRTHD